MQQNPESHSMKRRTISYLFLKTPGLWHGNLRKSRWQLFSNSMVGLPWTAGFHFFLQNIWVTNIEEQSIKAWWDPGQKRGFLMPKMGPKHFAKPEQNENKACRCL